MHHSTQPLLLAVDDDDDSRRLLERFLANGGYQVLPASSGEAALDLLRTRKPDLILMDVNMPGLNGYETCAQVQQLPNAAYVPVIFITARNEEQDRARAFAVGAADYLTKPVRKEALLETVKTHLETRSRWYQVQSASDLWDEAPLPQKFAEFRELMTRRWKLNAELANRVASVRSAEVYSFTQHLNVSEEELARQMAGFFGIDYVESVPAEQIQLGVLPTAYCRANQVVACRNAEGEEFFLISNPFSWGLGELDVLNNASRGKPRRLLLTHQRALSSLFGGKPTAAEPEPELDPRVIEEEELAEKQVSFDQLFHEAHQTSAVEIVNTLITDAVRRGASDIHIQPSRSNVRVRYRIDGELRTIMPLENSQMASMVARVKIICGMDIAEMRKPQDGRCMVRVDGRDVELRASTLPGTHGEKIVLRVLSHGAEFQSLANLGFEPDMLASLQKILKAKQGMVLITGPTGSGKTTVLYAGLNHLNTENVNIITVEDPVEIDLEGVTQVQVHERAGRTFSSALRSMLRQDPDIIMVGEIRDGETAEIACRAALTGHLVLSTVHTQHTLATLVRMVDMGVPAYLVASSLNGILAQRLAHRVCKHCAEPYDPPVELRKAMERRFGSLAGAQFKHGAGCARCNRSGVLGRIAIFELLVVNDDLRQMMMENANQNTLREYVSQRGFRTLEEDAFIKACKGLIPPEEIAKLGFSVGTSLEAEKDAPEKANGVLHA